MWLELPNLWIGLLNGLGIPAAHFGISWLFTKLPLRWFSPELAPFRPFQGESASYYDRWFKPKSWKSLLPDAGPWFGGFAKRCLKAATPAFLARFRAETCRSEAAHWSQMAVIACFILWTPWPWSIIVLIYSVASNLPCIVLQRQNRLRLAKVLKRHAKVA